MFSKHVMKDKTESGGTHNQLVVSFYGLSEPGEIVKEFKKSDSMLIRRLHTKIFGRNINL